MSFRREIKSTLNKNKFSNLLKWIQNNGGRILFPTRLINTIYFDNRNLTIYNESIEGILPRKKIRLRIYEKESSLDKIKKDSNLEYKISSVEGRFKITKKFLSKDKRSFLEIRDKDYGLCQPVLNVVYKRTYYKIKNIRLTIDQDISYKSVRFARILPYTIKDNLNVVELKYSKIHLDNKVLESFPFQFNRFSKYCSGIEFIQKKICDEIT